MRGIYLKNYAEAKMMRASLHLLWSHGSSRPENPKTILAYGLPLYFTNNNAPYISTFIRAADRSLYHAANVWGQLTRTLAKHSNMAIDLPSDAHLHTGERNIKYDIEAFLAAAITITEKNLIGIEPNNVNRLGKSAILGPQLIQILHNLAKDFLKLGFDSKWRAVRNSSTHLDEKMTDWGFTADIRRNGDVYKVVLDGIYSQEGIPSDLIELFSECYREFVNYIQVVRDILTAYVFEFIDEPKNNLYIPMSDPLGNMIVSLNADGFVLKHVPETADDFVGASILGRGNS